MKNQMTPQELHKLEEIAKQVMGELPHPQITGRGYDHARLKSPRNKAVWRVLCYDDKSTGRGSR